MPDNFPKTHTIVRWRMRDTAAGRPVERTVTVPRFPSKEETLAAAAEVANVLFIEDKDVIEIRHIGAGLKADGTPADPSTTAATFQTGGDNLPPDNSYRLPQGHFTPQPSVGPMRPPKWLPPKEAAGNYDPDENKPGHEDGHF